MILSRPIRASTLGVVVALGVLLSLSSGSSLARDSMCGGGWTALTDSSLAVSGDGIVLEVLAEGAASDLRQFIPEYLVFEQLVIQPGDMLNNVSDAGPKLFLIDGDQTALFVQGRLIPPEDHHRITSQWNQSYSLIHDGFEPAHVWRLHLADDAPPGSQIAVVRTPVPGSSAATAISDIAVSLLFEARTERVPADARLFIACLTISGAPGSFELVQFNGPIGLFVEAGELQLGDSTLGPGSCFFLDRGSVYEVSGEGPVSALVFGAVPDGQPVWTELEVPPSRSTTNEPLFRCY